MPRKRHVSRNRAILLLLSCVDVMPRKRHVSRNVHCHSAQVRQEGHASQEACE